ncbi:hypothetical protein DH2020_018535 [Rehmannia glutinosa]|uniref:Protein TIFY n=1 Tax=Rehmannia glutinosa TaxID=99300 RepID=A0ABR0WJ94_REHGL
MGSAEIVDSGRFSGGRSNFSQTCSLLSQYLKEKGSFGDLKLGLTQNLETKEAGSPTETMNLLPMIEKSGSGSRNINMLPALFPHPAAGRDETLAKPQPETAQMTIFYAGQVIVFDDFPADKAKEIMTLASKSSAAQNRPIAAFPPLHVAQSPAESTNSVPQIVPTFGILERPHHSAQPPLDSDLPIARKNSLARFLEKRKDRIIANAPYPASKPAPPPKAVKTEAWLGLAPELH